MTLVVLFLAAEAADLLTYLQMPALEDNPIVMDSWTPAIVLAKVLGPIVVAALAFWGLSSWRREFMLGFAVAFAAFCAGANMATVSIFRSLVG